MLHPPTPRGTPSAWQGPAPSPPAPSSTSLPWRMDRSPNLPPFLLAEIDDFLSLFRHTAAIPSDMEFKASNPSECRRLQPQCARTRRPRGASANPRASLVEVGTALVPGDGDGDGPDQ